MSTTLQSRLLKGFAAHGFAHVVNLLIQACGVLVYLPYWGSALYGEWLLLSSILSYLSISDLSFGNAAQPEMSMRVARGDKEGALVVFQSTWLLVTVISGVITVLSLLILPWLPLRSLLNLSITSAWEASLVIILLVLQVLIAQQGGILTAGFRCDGHYHVAVTAQNTLRLAEFLVGVATVILRGGLWQLAASVLVTRVIGYVFLYLLMRRGTPWLYVGRQHARMDVLKPLIRPAISYNAFPIGFATSINGILVVIGHFFGPVAVTLFSTARTLTRFIYQIGNAISQTIWAELSTAFGAQDLALARRIHRRACQVGVWAALILSLALAVVVKPLYRWWTHGKVPFDPSLFALLMLVVICGSLWSTSYTVPLSINKHQRLAVVFLLATTLSLGLAALFVQFWGINGAAIALFSTEIIMNIYVVKSSLALLEDDFGSFIREVLTPPLGWLWHRLARARVATS